MYIQEHQKKWDLLHSDDNTRLKYPNESVIRFIKSNFPYPSENNILDLGCGSGRHVIYLANEGYQVTGVDFSKPSIDFVRDYLKLKSLSANLSVNSVTSLPFSDQAFDGIISFGVLLYLSKEDIEVSWKEIFRVLKKGGKAFIVVRGVQDLRYGMGVEIEPNTFRLNDDSTNECGMIMHFFTPEEISALCCNFTEVKIGFIKQAFANLQDFNFDYLITLTK